MTNSVWDDPDLKAGGEFVSFDNVGDSVSGIIDVIRTHRFDDGKVVPQLLITTDDGEERTLTAGQIRLKAELVNQRPEVGDHLKVVLTQIEKRQGGKTMKHFGVEVTRGAKPTAPVVDSEAAEKFDEALAGLTPEQRQALGLPPF